MTTPSYDEALDTVIVRALRWARIQEQSRSALEALGEDVDARIAELDEAVEIVRSHQLATAEPEPPRRTCGIMSCVLPEGHRGWPDYGHSGRTCGHAECADDDGHIDACLHETADQGD